MVTDIKIGQDKDILLDDTNDLATVSGDEQLQQSVAIDVLDETRDFVSGRVTGQNIGQLENAITNGLNDDPQIANVRTVTIDTYNKEEGTINITVTTVKNENFNLTLTE